MHMYIPSRTDEALYDRIWVVTLGHAIWRYNPREDDRRTCEVVARKITWQELLTLRSHIRKYNMVCELQHHVPTKGIALHVYDHPNPGEGLQPLMSLCHEHIPRNCEHAFGTSVDRAYTLFAGLTEKPPNPHFVTFYGLKPTEPREAYAP